MHIVSPWQPISTRVNYESFSNRINGIDSLVMLSDGFNFNPFMSMQSKSMDWFLYDNGLRRERVKIARDSSNLNGSYLAFSIKEKQK